MSIFSGMLQWTENVFAPLGAWGLFILAFVESSVFPIPPDFLLIVLCLARPELALFYALVCTIGSVLGGMGGYGIGLAIEKTVLERFFSHRQIARVHKMFEKYETWAVFIGGFTPIPYKLFTITAGLLYADIKKFIIASLFGRALRFFIVATSIMFYGDVIVDILEKYFNILTLILVVLAIVGYYAYRKEKKWIKKIF